MFGEETDDPTIIYWVPSASVFCHDLDGHLIEYLALLADDPISKEVGRNISLEGMDRAKNRDRSKDRAKNKDE